MAAMCVVSTQENEKKKMDKKKISYRTQNTTNQDEIIIKTRYFILPPMTKTARSGPDGIPVRPFIIWPGVAEVG
jgi:hypothetical protein